MYFLYGIYIVYMLYMGYVCHIWAVYRKYTVNIQCIYHICAVYRKNTVNIRCIYDICPVYRTYTENIRCIYDMRQSYVIQQDMKKYKHSKKHQHARIQGVSLSIYTTCLVFRVIICMMLLIQTNQPFFVTFQCLPCIQLPVVDGRAAAYPSGQ